MSCVGRTKGSYVGCFAAARGLELLKGSWGKEALPGRSARREGGEGAGSGNPEGRRQSAGLSLGGMGTTSASGEPVL